MKSMQYILTPFEKILGASTIILTANYLALATLLNKYCTTSTWTRVIDKALLVDIVVTEVAPLVVTDVCVVTFDIIAEKF